MFFKPSIILLFSCGLLLSCNDEPKSADKPIYQENDLIGRWELQKGFRNGKETETLTGTYYEFGQEGTMKTNLTPTTMEQVYDFSFSDNKIKQTGGTTIEYSIDSLTPDFLSMSMVINNFPFQLHLTKAAPAVQMEASDTFKMDSLKEL